MRGGEAAERQTDLATEIPKPEPSAGEDLGGYSRIGVGEFGRHISGLSPLSSLPLL